MDKDSSELMINVDISLGLRSWMSLKRTPSTVQYSNWIKSWLILPNHPTSVVLWVCAYTCNVYYCTKTVVTKTVLKLKTINFMEFHEISSLEIVWGWKMIANWRAKICVVPHLVGTFFNGGRIFNENHAAAIRGRKNTRSIKCTGQTDYLQSIHMIKWSI